MAWHLSLDKVEPTKVHPVMDQDCGAVIPVNVLCKIDQSHMALGPRKSGVFGRCAARNSLRCGLKKQVNAHLDRQLA